MDQSLGALLDSSVVIAAERSQKTVEGLIMGIADQLGDRRLALSAIGYTELLHGFYREREPGRRSERQLFLASLLAAMPVYPYTREIAVLAGRIGGRQAALGLTIPPVDLKIGATALSLNFSILTANDRHFRLIPNLEVIPF